MGKCFKILIVLTAVLAALIAYLFFDPLPNYMDELFFTRFMILRFKLVSIFYLLGVPLGFGSSINMTRIALRTTAGVQLLTRDKADEIEISNFAVDGVHFRVYKPRAAKGTLPGLVYFHGGGWVLLDIDSYDDVMVNQALKGSLIAVSVEYRLAPEHPFPAGFQDCAAVARHILQHGGKYGIDTKRVAIGGDSAGGNLAAAVVIQLRDENFQPPVGAQLLIYGAFTFCHYHFPIYEYRKAVNARDSVDQMFDFMALYLNFTEGQTAAHRAYNFTPEFISKCEQYSSIDLLPENFIPPGYRKFQYPKCDVTDDVETISARLSDRRLAPALVEDLRGLPPTFLLSVQWDFLRDDSAIFATRLTQAGVKVDWYHIPDTFHGVFSFFYGPNKLRRGELAQDKASDFLVNNL